MAGWKSIYNYNGHGINTSGGYKTPEENNLARDIAMQMGKQQATKGVLAAAASGITPGMGALGGGILGLLQANEDKNRLDSKRDLAIKMAHIGQPIPSDFLDQPDYLGGMLSGALSGAASFQGNEVAEGATAASDVNSSTGLSSDVYMNKPGYEADEMGMMVPELKAFPTVKSEPLSGAAGDGLDTPMNQPQRVQELGAYEPVPVGLSSPVREQGAFPTAEKSALMKPIKKAPVKVSPPASVPYNGPLSPNQPNEQWRPSMPRSIWGSMLYGK